jgi:hypothetical protein
MRPSPSDDPVMNTRATAAFPLIVTIRPDDKPGGNANADGERLRSTGLQARHRRYVYKLGVAQFAQQMHPDLPGPTHFWGYYDLATGNHRLRVSESKSEVSYLSRFHLLDAIGSAWLNL